jgi:hypothetical protein
MRVLLKERKKRTPLLFTPSTIASTGSTSTQGSSPVSEGVTGATMFSCGVVFGSPLARSVTLLDNFRCCHWPMRYRSTTINTARHPSTTLDCCASTCVCELLDKDRNDVNEGVEEGTLVCVALVGATGKEGTVVERTTYGQYGRCSLSKSIWRAFWGTAEPAFSPLVGRLARGAEPTAQSPSRLRHREQCKSEVSLRRSGATLPLGLQGITVSNDVGRKDGVLF